MSIALDRLPDTGNDRTHQVLQHCSRVRRVFNFAEYPIKIGKRTWPTSEHYFQAMKFKEDAQQREIRSAESPMIAARIGRDRKRPLRRDWDSVKVGVMQEAVLAKFSQHEELRELLLATGDAKIIEHTENDSYWGDGGNGKGRNMLGRILMQVRDQLQEEDRLSQAEW